MKTFLIILMTAAFLAFAVITIAHDDFLALLFGSLSVLILLLLNYNQYI